MIIACPECGTRYSVDDAAFPAAGGGRQLRCAHCGHRWRHAAAAETEVAAAAETKAPAETGAAAAVAGPAAETVAPALTAVPAAQPELTLRAADGDVSSPPPAPSALPRPSVTADPPAQRHHRALWAAALGAAALAAAVVLALILGRDRIETLFPATTALYAKLHLDAPGAGLKVTVVPIRRADALVVSGDIVNAAPAPRLVPRLRLTLLDANRTNLVSKVIDPPVARLSPGAKAHFNTVFEHPGDAAVRVDVTYAAN